MAAKENLYRKGIEMALVEYAQRSAAKLRRNHTPVSRLCRDRAPKWPACLGRAAASA